MGRSSSALLTVNHCWEDVSQALRLAYIRMDCAFARWGRLWRMILMRNGAAFDNTSRLLPARIGRQRIFTLATQQSHGLDNGLLDRVKQSLLLLENKIGESIQSDVAQSTCHRKRSAVRLVSLEVDARNKRFGEYFGETGGPKPIVRDVHFQIHEPCRTSFREVTWLVWLFL